MITVARESALSASLAISHRSSDRINTIMDYDYIVVLDAGKVHLDPCLVYR